MGGLVVSLHIDIGVRLPSTGHSKESQKVMKTKLRDVKLIIVDEISMDMHLRRRTVWW